MVKLTRIVVSVLATVIMIVDYDFIVIMIVDYDFTVITILNYELELGFN
jgi:hypothetical protein